MLSSGLCYLGQSSEHQFQLNYQRTTCKGYAQMHKVMPNDLSATEGQIPELSLIFCATGRNRVQFRVPPRRLYRPEVIALMGVAG